MSPKQGKHGKKNHSKHRHLKHHHPNHQQEKTSLEGNGELESRPLSINSNVLDSIKTNLEETSLPILLGKDGDTNKWKLESGKDLESGLVYKGHMPESGTFWKVEFVLDCSAEAMYESITQKLDVSWIPYLMKSDVLDRKETHAILHQRIHGVLGVSDRDFIIAQFCGQISQQSKRTYYSLTRSIPDGYVEESSDCVRGEYLPSGWAWTNEVDDNGVIRCQSTLIYNLDLKGIIPKAIIQLAASSFLTRHVKAAQEHAAKLLSSPGSSDAVISNPVKSK